MMISELCYCVSLLSFILAVALSFLKTTHNDAMRRDVEAMMRSDELNRQWRNTEDGDY